MRQSEGAEPVPAFPPDFRMLRIRGVCDVTGLSRAAIYRAVRVDGFPPPVKIGPANSKSSAVAWVDHEVREWLKRKVSASRARP